MMYKYLLDDNGVTKQEMWFEDFDNSFRLVETQAV